MTLITAFVLHSDPGHLFGNLYFLLTLGDNVEDFLGPWMFATLLLLADFGAAGLHALVDPRSTVPVIGASGAISGVMAFYALRFPNARLRLNLGPTATRAMSVWTFFLFWVSLQVIGLVLQSRGMSSVSAGGHLGGVLVGTLFWIGEEAHSRYRRQAIMMARRS